MIGEKIIHIPKLFNSTINRVPTYFIVTNIQHNDIVKELHSNAADAGGGGSTRNLPTLSVSSLCHFP